jgi:hypothetical protein
MREIKDFDFIHGEVTLIRVEDTVQGGRES